MKEKKKKRGGGGGGVGGSFQALYKVCTRVGVEWGGSAVGCHPPTPHPQISSCGESPGGHPGLPTPNSLCGLCGHKARQHCTGGPGVCVCVAEGGGGEGGSCT